MAQTYKILAQFVTSATTLTDVYTVPASSSAVLSAITVCNRGSSSTSFRVSMASNGAADHPKQYRWYDLSIAGNDTFEDVAGHTLAAADVIRFYSANTMLSINVSGAEIG